MQKDNSQTMCKTQLRPTSAARKLSLFDRNLPRDPSNNTHDKHPETTRTVNHWQPPVFAPTSKPGPASTSHGGLLTPSEGPSTPGLQPPSGLTWKLPPPHPAQVPTQP